MSDRCPWCGTDPLYVTYHDQEWGIPQRDPRALWECLMLEGFQAGLSWITILRRRETFRAAFAGFDPATIAQWGEPEVTRLLGDPGIIRHRGKIEGTILSARAYLRIEADEGFSPYLWKHVGHRPQQNQPRSGADIPAQTPASVALSKQLRQDGFKFCGPTIVYAFMQAVGMVNDHLVTCPSHGHAASFA
ncbi:DNA-3-methyladenine glycosylase I [Paragemmobacter straminiformis]|uniref:DNA-3-methyladenine glycosylase I n=1 Tax=Paragemmobacter straminiformis TaxID=2045119 RepID=A0A842I7E1_9RHOB|nr:DNA-3-methyladenine glycosylase I [Gemmobacter straminiformis]MBC2834898.1 DNA-3-methyladenine glycosylase I [Gemmobacter straminiformis]